MLTELHYIALMEFYSVMLTKLHYNNRISYINGIMLSQYINGIILIEFHYDTLWNYITKITLCY